MSQINSNAGLLGAGGTQPRTTSTDAFGALDTGAFLDLMVAELQNQDPLDPADNEQLLSQIFQIRQIESDEALTETLQAVLLGQNVASATNLIGADIVGLTDSGQRVNGSVRSVAVDGGEPTLEVAVEPFIGPGDAEGEVGQGRYVYEVVWDAADEAGTDLSVELATGTEDFEDFGGSIRLENLPETNGVKRVFRTDATGQGPRQFVGTVSASGTSFLDTRADAELGRAYTGTAQRVPFASSLRVRLSNVAEISPPENGTSPAAN